MGQRKTLFIVDDDQDDQEVFMQALEQVDNSIECFNVSTCEEALDLLKDEKKHKPDFIFLDLNLPRINGKQCLTELRKMSHLKHVPIIIYSTSSEKRDIEETSKLGAAHFLTKPDKFGELCKALNNLLSVDWSVAGSLRPAS
jgi:CheY-like chemotaxis protein